MNALAVTELKLFTREPGNLLAGIALPSALLAGLGAIPALREPAAMFGGGSFLAFFAPSLLAISIAVLGLQTLPVGLATYREKGILRRFAVSPVSPASVLVAQLVITLVSAVAATVLLVTVAVAGFGLPFPRHPLGFLAAFVLGTAAVFSLGLLVAALAPRSRAAAASGTVLFMACQFFAGVYLPKFLLPDAIVTAGTYVPPGITAFTDAWTGAGPRPGPLLAMAGVALVATIVAVRSFRWQ